MKTPLAFHFLFLLLATQASASDLQFSIRGQSAALVNEPAISCGSRLRSIRENKTPAKDVPAPHFGLIDPRITFESSVASQYAIVSALQLRLDSPELAGNSHQCLFEPLELGGLFGLGTDYVWSGNIAANDTISINPTCLVMVCGGLKLKNPQAASLTAKLTVRLIGLIKDSRSGEERPILSEFTHPRFRLVR